MVGLGGARDAVDVSVRGGGLQCWGGRDALLFAVQPAIGGHYKATNPGLGENGVTFAKGQTTATINGIATTVDQIASFNLSFGAPNWTYQATPGDTLSIIVAATGNGLSVKTTDQNNNDTIISLDSTGASVGASWAGNNVDYFVGDRWTGMATGSSTTEYSGPLIQFSTSGWFSPQQEKGNQAARNR